MHVRRPNEKVPKEPVIEFVDQQWYKTFVGRPTPMLQLDEAALVAAGMSMLWAPKNPRHAPAYGYKGNSYGLMNALNPKVCGEMAARIHPEGELPWLEQIKGYFHHPTEESLAAYTPARTGANPSVFARPKTIMSPTREETILLSSEESIASSDELVHRSRSTRAGVDVDHVGGFGTTKNVEHVVTAHESVAKELAQEEPEVPVQPGA
ncbi:hypothetical protein HanRHA438_Chr15g0683001 [Helianthus annuus]|uniref:Uncharacterized protein n=1 Tax=Helianthus annuus TaxID=4232 RepID=A0A9K3H136_HELAN|nr:hypothetical protein HanXRQr2_Chr15g0671041 [Helianthus annuus]KAJ0471345.1 hypothetical protein HanHA89_Chr15g0595261 [Helianthus annuus]KAJ0646960.1 hypothetical protein HanLR1_Chr15g0556791 [Helianthus annuus]KAJ0842657.1 hypothetical protein HanRHA438_Chr15g0683001 [Helianthus annuus]